MDKAEIMAMIEEAIIKERWRIANRIECFDVSQNAIDNDSYSSTYAIDDWNESCVRLANQIRGIDYNSLNFWNFGATDDGKISFRCKQCEYKARNPRLQPFECSVFTKENFYEENGKLKPVCPKCGAK